MGMVGKEDGSRVPYQVAGNRKTFWRSASWSSSRTGLRNPESEEKDCSDPNGGIGNNSGQNRRFPAPLTPRSQQNCKARACLPPLQPLSIARRSLDEWPKASSDDVGEWPQPPTPSGRDMNKGGDRLKLDLSAIQKNPDKNGGLVRRDKIAFFDKECSKVAEHIYLGGDAVAKDREILKHNRIAHILNCVGFVCPEYFRADFVYRTLWLQDSPSEDITSILYDVFDYFEDVREQGGRVFVHCCQGVSRSTSLVIAYLMWREGQSFEDAFQYVKAARGIADPNMGFACQLLQCQKRVHAFPLSPSSLLRMYRIAPHSPYDPLHLVPKMLNDPSPSALDSRGAFIVHVPSAIYVWIGKNCEFIMERDARAAVCQIVRYERVQGPITVIKEGEEQSYFWDAFSNLLPLMDKSVNGVEVGKSMVDVCLGERKVDSYNVDYEIFKKAISGGFVPPFASSETEHETHLPVRESSWSALRRKFAFGNMKEFISAPRLSFHRVFSDSMLIVGVDNFMNKPSHSPANSSTSSSPPSSSSSSASSSSSSSSSSSPPYLSPDSISSDSSGTSKYFSESPLMSPSTVACPLPLSSTLSTLSNLSLFTSSTSNTSSQSASNASFQSVSNNPELVSVTSQHSSQSVSLPFKRFPVSLAERRGSLSKSLTLPVLTDETRLKNNVSTSVSCQEDAVRIDVNTCSFSEPCSSVEHVSEFKNGARNGDGNSTEQCELRISSGRVASDDSHKDIGFVRNGDETLRNDPLEGSQDSTVLTGMMEAHGDPVQPLVCCWPSLEKFASFGAGDLDSKAAFVFFFPSTGLGKAEDRIIYIWVGRSFNHGNTRALLDSSREVGDLEEIDWNQVGCDVRSQLGLPEDTAIKVQNLCFSIFCLILLSFLFFFSTSKFVLCLFISYVMKLSWI